MAAPVLVTGGTGTLGRLVVPRLRAAGREVRVLSRRRRELGEGIEVVTGDLATGEGIEPAVDGAGTIVHCAGSSKGDEDKARNLVRAASRAGAAHLVYISVVGVAERAEHPVGHRPQAGPVLLEAVGQPLVVVHRSHSPAANCHTR